MKDRSPFCGVCDESVMPGAPIQLCAGCIKAAYRFAQDCITTVPESPFEVLRCHVCDSVVAKDAFGIGVCATCAFAISRHVDTYFGRVEYAKLRNQQIAEDQLQAGESRVYYIRIGDQIKIGVSIDPLQRARSLSLTSAHIVAVEPGTRVTEVLRHGQFYQFRIHGEWFMAEPELLAHIERLNTEAA